MTGSKAPIAVLAANVPPRKSPSSYPEPFAGLMAQREKRALGDFFGLRNFGVNLTRIAPGGQSALMHTHSKQDELIYILEGEAVLATPSGETPLSAGMCAGFPARGEPHHVLNRGDLDVVMLEIGDRTEGDVGCYPHDDIQAVMGARSLRRRKFPASADFFVAAVPEGFLLRRGCGIVGAPLQGNGTDADELPRVPRRRVHAAAGRHARLAA